MASLKLFGHLGIALIAHLAMAAMATNYTVGDDKGWTVNFDYKEWAKGKEFMVGDKLIFNYTQGAHNVFPVDGAAFNSCTVPASGALKSGKDEIPLDSAGKKWYLCGVGNGKHCELGQKLAIEVKDTNSTSTNSAPPSFPIFFQALALSQLVAALLVLLNA